MPTPSPSPELAYDFLTTFDWSTFLSQLIAGLVAAAVGVFGVLLGFALQRRASYQDALDAAAAEILEQFGLYDRAMTDFVHAVRSFSGGSLPPRPSMHALSTAVNVAGMRARGRDRQITRGLRTVLLIADLEAMDEAVRTDALRTLARAVTYWRGAEGNRETAHREIEQARKRVTEAASGHKSD